MPTTAKPMHVNDALNQLISAVMRFLTAQNSEPHVHSDDELWYSREQVQFAARNLANATDAAASPSDIPVGWRPKTKGPATDLTGTIRRKPGGTVLAILWPSPPAEHRWMTSDQWGSCGYETNETVADWPVVGSMPFSPAAGIPFTPITTGPGTNTVMTTSEVL